MVSSGLTRLVAFARPTSIGMIFVGMLVVLFVIAIWSVIFLSFGGMWMEPLTDNNPYYHYIGVMVTASACIIAIYNLYTAALAWQQLRWKQ